MRRTVIAVATLPVLLALATAPAASAAPALSGSTVEYNVLAKDGATADATAQAIRAAGGTVVKRNDAVGLFTVAAPEHGFTDRMATARPVLSAARSRVIGQVPDGAKPGRAGTRSRRRARPRRPAGTRRRSRSARTRWTPTSGA
ncbi:hypothetical protein GCM10029964_006790 [Kibdelosporangium lantanae]